MTTPEEDKSELQKLREENQQLNKDNRFLLAETKRAWNRALLGALIIFIQFCVHLRRQNKPQTPETLSYVSAELVPTDIPQIELSDESTQQVNKSKPLEELWCSKFGIPLKDYQTWKTRQMPSK